MKGPTLVVMAAGIGSRYGGLKQIDPVGPNGEIIIDYSVHDALKAGFESVVFIIKEDIEEAFREKIGQRVEKLVDTRYAYQRVEDLPAGFQVPEGRTKPWGTGHAVLSCRPCVNSPFAVINADDFYGPASFRVLSGFLKGAEDKGEAYEYGLVGFVLENTLTEHGHVARGVCTTDEKGYLKEIHERTRIRKFPNGSRYTEDGEHWVRIPEGSTVSMNTWGFTPGIFTELEKRFPEFLEKNRDNLFKAEYFLPEVVNGLISSGKGKVKVLPSEERWYGITYREDMPLMRQAVADMVRRGIYPEKLWSE